MTDRDLTLVVPCFNEAARLDRVAFLDALQNRPWLRLCFVDDGSTDDTALTLSALQQQAPDRVSIVTLQRNAGKAEAVRQGLLVACDRTPYCGFWDADLAAPLREVETLFDVFTREPGVEWVWAIRLRSLGRSVTRGALRHYAGRIFATAASAVVGVAVYDTQCGAKLFRSSALLNAVISEPFSSRWIFDVEMLSRATAMMRDSARPIESIVYEQPLREWHHVRGSKVRAIDAVHAFAGLLLIRSQRQKWLARRAMS